MFKRAMVLIAFSLAAVCASRAAFARVDVGVFVNTPGPVYAAPPVVYAPAPPVVYAPPAYGYGYRDDYHRRHGWHHDHGYHRGWERHHGRGW
jgi:hypothetical protein